MLGLYNGEAEREEFETWVSDGKFYERLDGLLEKPYGNEKRDKLKKAVLSVFFDHLRPKPSKLCRAFATKFPVLYEKLNELKKGDYRKAALRLQSDEASIIIRGVVRSLAKIGKIPVLTVHDSILTTSEHCDEVKALMQETFIKKLGVAPALKVKSNSLNSLLPYFPANEKPSTLSEAEMEELMQCVL